MNKYSSYYKTSYITIFKQKELNNLKKRLEESDYKIIKSYEYHLMNMLQPYDIEILHEERQALRDQINQLQEELENIQEEENE